MGLPVAKHRYTIAEYLELEREALDRHEYHDGEILAMSGGSVEQSIISANIMGEMRNALKGKPCRVADSNLRVRISRQGRYVYPDALVFCGPPQFDPQDDQRHTLLNPRVIIEVLSPSTEAYDRGEKFAHYRQIESFEEYVLIAQDKPNVESWLRQPDGAWSIATHTAMDGAAAVRCLGVTIPLAEIYAGVEWPAPGEAA
jgi:Uma2 family endonuclease